MKASSGTVMSVDSSMKPQSQVLSEFLSAATPTHWMFDEVGEYLFGEKPEDEREELLDDLFDRLDEERDRLNTLVLDPLDIVEFQLRVEKPGGRSVRTSYSTIPSPVLLLELCLKMCSMGDEVLIEHVYASGDACGFRSEWPFGMDWAVRSTTPMGETLADEAEEELDEAVSFKTGESRSRIAAIAGAAGVVGAIVGAVFGRLKR